MRLGWIVVIVAGCSGEAAPCVALGSGAWTFDGDTFGGPMSATLVMDAPACTFTLAWAEGVEGLPSGGAIDGAELRLAGDDPGWATCTGAISEGGSTVEGECAAGSFTMTRPEEPPPT